MVGIVALGLAAWGGVGDVLEAHDLPRDSRQVQGLAVDEDTGALVVLDASDGGAVHVWRPEGDGWTHQARHALPEPLTAPRGLSITRDADGDPLLWMLDWDPDAKRGTLWRQDPKDGEARSVPLGSLGIPTEPTGLTWHGDTLWIAHWPTGPDDGLVRLTMPAGGAEAWLGGTAPGVRTFSGSGHRQHDTWQPSRGLTVATVDGVPYLFGTASTSDVVAMDADTGRALFTLPTPRTLDGPPRPAWGVAWADDGLWVVERSKGPERLHRLDVHTDLDTPATTPWRLRHLTLNVTTEPKDRAPRRPGTVTHTYGHPAPLASQEPVEGTRVARDESPSRGAAPRHVTETWHPADDPAVPIVEDRFEYPDVRPRTYRSEVEVDARVREVRWWVYPHRVSGEGAPPGYTDDDETMYRLSDRQPYERFLDRVRDLLADRYGLSAARIEAELDHPYWAARAVTETIFASYWYPNDDAGHRAVTDPEVGHYSGSPTPLKLALSDRLDGDELVACNGGTVMLVGVMRYLGHPARWLGSTHPGRGDALRRDDPDAHWDRDGDRFLDPGEAMVGVNGHRWSQVWMGPRYGWQKVDATPEARATEGPLGRPPPPSQWDLVREVAGFLPVNRIVLTVGSEARPTLIRTFAPPAVGGDHAMNLAGLYEHPQHWKYPDHDIAWSTPLALNDVGWSRPDDASDAVEVHWRADGPWDRLEGATVTVRVERWEGDLRNGPPRVLATGVPVDAGSVTGALPAPPPGMRWRAVVVQDGDPLVGGRSR